MSLASHEDANAWLDGVKLSFPSQAAAASIADNADNVVKSYLASTYPAYVNTWDVAPGAGQEATPQVVREAAAMLMAAYYYALKYSEETLDDNDYAAKTERRAIKLLENIRDGLVSLWDKSYGLDVSNQLNLAEDDFYPDDKAVVEKDIYDAHDESVRTEFVPDRKFSMSDPF